MPIESDPLAVKKAEYGSSTTTTVKFTPTLFRHPNGDIVREVQLETGLEYQNLTGDGTLEKKKEGIPNDITDTDIPITEQFQLPQSSYCLLISSEICSFPFNTGILALGLSLMCLACVLWYTLANPLTQGHAQTEVIIAKYVGVVMAVLMEDEIPTGIDLIGKGAQQVLSGGRRKISMKRIVFSSMVRFTVGYLFLANAFLLIIQQMAVLPTFLSVLGLLFVERIDDAIFAVSKRGEIPSAYIVFFTYPQPVLSKFHLNANMSQRILWAKNSCTPLTLYLVLSSGRVPAIISGHCVVL